MRTHINWISTLWILILVSGCGFQLNRNQINLPNQANNIQIAKIQNTSFRPGLDLDLEDQLNRQFSNSGISIIPSPMADLTLKFNILKTMRSKTPHSLQSGSQTYLYSFSISGILSLKDNRDNSFIYKNLTLNSTSSLETTSTDLSDTEEKTGMEKSVSNLGKIITAKLIQTF